MISYVQLLEVLYGGLPKQILSPILQKLSQQIKSSEKISRKETEAFLAEPFDEERWEKLLENWDNSMALEYKLRTSLDTALTKFKTEQAAQVARREEKEARRLYEQLKERFG